MANIASSSQYINDVEVSSDAPVTEAVLDKMGGSINYCLDHVAAASNNGLSSSCGAYNSVSASWQDITNLSVTVTCTGRPGILALVSDASATDSKIFGDGAIRFIAGATEYGRWYTGVDSGPNTMKVVPWQIIFPTSGSKTFKAQAFANVDVTLQYWKFVFIEL